MGGEWEWCFDFEKEGEGLAGRGLRTVMVEGRQCMCVQVLGRSNWKCSHIQIWVRVGVAFVMMRRRHSGKKKVPLGKGKRRVDCWRRNYNFIGLA